MQRLLASVRVAVLAGASLASGAVHADEPAADTGAPAASMQCERAVQPGRMRCTAEVHVAGNRAIAWADLVLVELPDLAAALKGRIGPADVTAREPTRTTWAFGLVARKTGQGEARGKVRVVVCEPAAETDAGAPRCAPHVLEVKTPLQVGPG